MQQARAVSSPQCLISWVFCCKMYFFVGSCCLATLCIENSLEGRNFIFVSIGGDRQPFAPWRDEKFGELRRHTPILCGGATVSSPRRREIRYLDLGI